MITFRQQETTEIKNRIRAAWATFHKYRQELTWKNYMLKHGLRLFDAAITRTICYAAGTWAPTKEHERMIQSTQRKMLRLIHDSDVSFESDNYEEIDAAEIEEEDWVDYIIRSTNEAMEKMGNEKLLNRTLNSAQNTGPTQQFGDQEEDGKMTSTNSSNLLRKRQKT